MIAERYHEQALEPVEALLIDWARFMRKGVLTFGYLNSAHGCVGGGYSSSFEDLLEAVEDHVVRAVDAIIQGMARPRYYAIQRCYLGAVYPCRAQCPYYVALEQAKEELALKARARGLLN